MKASQEYIDGMALKKCSIRSYKITIEEGKCKGISFIKQVYTPRISEYKYDKGLVKFIYDGVDYGTVEEVLEVINKN